MPRLLFQNTNIRKILLLVACFFLVALAAHATVIFGITNAWRYNQTANLDGVNWKAPAYDDSAWPSGPALLYSESNTNVAPRNTPLTLGRTNYYFRTHFDFAGSTNNAALTFSNKIDDGAVFYLNGYEIQRVRMPAAPAVITYTNYATSTPPGGDATGWDIFSIPATNVLSANNVLAVEVHQATPGSSDIVFGSALSIGSSLIRGPYLQAGSHTNIVVRWRTVVATNSTVRFGTNAANLTGEVSDSTATTEHELKLSNLLPDTKYFYSVGTTSDELAGGQGETNYFFVTAPLPGSIKPTRIWVLGDSGTADANQAAVRNAYYNFTTNRYTDLWLMLGDNAYETGLDSEFQSAVFDVYPEVLRQSVLWPALGNHDTAQATNYVNTYPYFSIFTLPTNGAAGGMASGTEHFYSFDYANIHFICLDSMTASRATNGAMANWLRADLISTTNDWIIAFWHHPPYSKGSHNSDTEAALIEMRQNFLPILEAGGVDLVLCGHSHVYERSFLLDGHYGYSTNLTTNMILNASSGRETNSAGPYMKWASGAQAHQGAVYVVAGSSGQTSTGPLNHPAMFISLQELGSLVLDINGDRLDAKFLRETGAIADQFTVVKRDVQIASAKLLTNGFQLSLTNVAAGKTNLIQASADFSNWISLNTNVARSNQFKFIDGQATNVDFRFYRVKRLP